MMLDKAEHDRIAAAIRAVEATTSGEIYCVIARRSSDYRMVPLIWGAMASLLVPALVALSGFDLHRLPLPGEAWLAGHADPGLIDEAVDRALRLLVLLQALAFLLMLGLTWPRAVRRLVTPPALARRATRRAAVDIFLAHGIHQTVERTGVLIYASLDERRAEIVADDLIDRAVDQSLWDAAIDDVTGGARSGRLAAGLIAAVERCGAALAAAFPRRPGDRNELPDRVVEI